MMLEKLKPPIELTRSMTLVLIVLDKKPLHGYAIMKAIESTFDDEYNVPAGTLYRSISTLVEHGLVEELANEHTDQRRRYYRITIYGRAVTTGELIRMAKLLEVARQIVGLLENDP